MKTYALIALVLAACVDDPAAPDELGEDTSEIGSTISYSSTEVPRSIPDNNPTGATSNITSYVDSFSSLTVDVNISHTYRGDLVITLKAPSGQVATLSNRAGGSADNYVVTGLDVTSTFASANPHGVWSLKVVDQALEDVGTINAFKLTFGGATATPNGTPPTLPVAIPDATSSGSGTATATFTSTLPGAITDIRLDATITHTRRSDLIVKLTSPSSTTITLATQLGDSGGIVISGLDLTRELLGVTAAGPWTLTVIDTRPGATGSITAFNLTMTAVTGPAPEPGPVGSFLPWSDSDFQLRAIPDNNLTGITATMNDYVSGNVQTVQVRLEIQHTYRGDLHVTLTSPSGQTVNVVTIPSTDYNDNIIGTFDVAGFTQGSPGFGHWVLKVWDAQYLDVGSLRSWSIGINRFAPQ